MEVVIWRLGTKTHPKWYIELPEYSSDLIGPFKTRREVFEEAEKYEGDDD